MATYRIVCTEQKPADKPPSHQHIVAVGTGSNPQKARNRWTLNEVLRALDSGDRFYTESPRGDKASVVSAQCWCGRRIIRSTPDATTENNLDSLRRCNF